MKDMASKRKVKQLGIKKKIQVSFESVSKIGVQIKNKEIKNVSTWLQMIGTLDFLFSYKNSNLATTGNELMMCG